MTSDKKVEIVNSVAEFLPERIKHIILNLPLRVKNSLNEIRLRAGRPLSLTVDGQNVFLATNGNVCYLQQHGLYIVNEQDIKNSFRLMCECSVYAYSNQVKSGYITLKNGCRVGLAASAVYENGEIINFSSISSLNIRIAAEYIDCAKSLTNYLDNGLLIAGPPSSSKTTLLRDAVRIISNGIGTSRKRVALIDTRMEIACVKDGIPQNDVGILTDVITGCEKAEGIEIALRTLNPEVIAFDEIGSLIEADAVIKGFNAGAVCLTTAHVGSLDEIKDREVIKMLIKSNVIKNIAFIEKPNGVIRVFSAVSLIEKINSRGESIA